MLLQNTRWKTVGRHVHLFKTCNSVHSLCLCNYLNTTSCLVPVGLPPEIDQSPHAIIRASSHRSLLLTLATQTARSGFSELRFMGPVRHSKYQAEPNLSNIMHL
jgi:hypothetical protein